MNIQSYFNPTELGLIVSILILFISVIWCLAETFSNGRNLAKQKEQTNELITLLSKQAETHRENIKQLETSNKINADYLNQIRKELNEPLYSVGNRVWFNYGADGTPGVYQTLEGVIEEVWPETNSKPNYLVRVANGTVLINQKDIIEWSN